MQKREKRTWIPDPKEAVKEQRLLAAKVVPTTPADFRPRYIAGVDVSCNRFSYVLYAGVVVWDLESQTLAGQATAIMNATFPYIPGLLSYREVPAIQAAWEKLVIKPDLVFVDGNGIAHPRRFGIASHLGVLWQRPTIGCAKSRLTGQHRTPGETRGSAVNLKIEHEVIGRVVRTKPRSLPIYVSVGHQISLADAQKWVLRLSGSYRLPLPIRLAHEAVNAVRRSAQT